MPGPKPKSKKKALTLAGVGAFLALVAGWLGSVGSISSTVSDLSKRFFPPPPPPLPYDVEVSYAKEMPFYLKNYYLAAEGLGKQESLRWFRAKVTKRMPGRLLLDVSFSLEPNTCGFVTLDANAKPQSYEIDAAEKDIEASPSLIYARVDSEDDCSLTVQYTIRDNRPQDQPHPIDRVNIRLLPPHTVKWDLTNIKGEPVSKEFLLASVSAWTRSREGNLVDRAGKLRNRAGSAPPDRLLKLCYDDLFQGQSGVTIYPTASTYPFKHETALRYPGKALADGYAEPLEAALLMAAIMHATAPGRVPLSLFILPQPKDPKNPAVLLAWLTPSGDAWEAINVTLANKLGFQENLQQSQELLRQALSQRPKILDALSDQGVLFGTDASPLTALSFDRAKEKFHIQGLP
jgi:hypothetical protein